VRPLAQMGIRVKGATLISTLALMRENLTPQKYQALLAQCPPETQHLLQRTLVAFEWIPADSWSPFLEAIFEQVAGRDESRYGRIMRGVCMRDYTVSYRSQISGLTPRALVAKLPQLWGLHFEGGCVATREVASHDGVTQAQAEVREFETRSLIYAPTIQAFIEQLLKMTGAQKLLVTRVRDSRRDGIMVCDYLMTFS
jgi:hypothetical protein